MNHFTKEEKKLFDYMSNFDDDELPDGAWEQVLKDSITEYNRINNTNHDEHDYWLRYVEYMHFNGDE